MLTLIELLQKFSINQLIVLYSIYKKDVSYIKARMAYENIEYTTYKQLADLKLIEEVDDKIIFKNLKLTPLGVEQSKEIANLFKPTKVDIDWIDEWYNLFPAKTKNRAGFFIKTDKADCNKKLEKLLSLYPEYNKDMIFKATKNYINQQSINRFEYCQKSNNFVSKDDTSTLLSYLENMNNNVIEDVPLGEDRLNTI